MRMYVITGGSMTVLPATLVDILGQEHLANGLGITAAVAGPSNMLILPVAGSTSIIYHYMF